MNLSIDNAESAELSGNGDPEPAELIGNDDPELSKPAAPSKPAESARDAGAEEPSDYDRLRRRVLWKMPSGLYVVGSRAGDKRNGMTLNWATQVSIQPKQIAIGVLKDALTHELIELGGAFSLNILSREDRAIVRKFVKPVEVNLGEMTLNGFAFRDGITGVPILGHAVAYLECEVRQQIDVGDHSVFIGEVRASGFQQDEETQVLRMEDTRMNYGG